MRHESMLEVTWEMDSKVVKWCGRFLNSTYDMGTPVKHPYSLTQLELKLCWPGGEGGEGGGGYTQKGPLTGARHVACRFYEMLMSHVSVAYLCPYRMSNVRNIPVAYHYLFEGHVAPQ